jgi:hypothetical protein
MSTTQFSFKARVKIGDDIVPVASEITVGSSSAENGVQNGFIFRLDRQANDPPVVINLGAIISFIEEQLGAGSGSLSQNPNLPLIQQIFPGPQSSPFTSGNNTIIEIQSFEVNSTTQEFLFSICVDIAGSNPSQGLINLPAELASWLTINNLAISFSATSKSS